MFDINNHLVDSGTELQILGISRLTITWLCVTYFWLYQHSGCGKNVCNSDETAFLLLQKFAMEGSLCANDNNWLSIFRSPSSQALNCYLAAM